MRTIIAALGLVLASAADAAADDVPEEVRRAVDAFLTAADAGADDVLAVSFAPKVALVDLVLKSPECEKTYGKKRSIKRGHAALLRCVFGERTPAPGSSYTILPSKKTYGVVVDGVTLRFRKRGRVYVIDRIDGLAAYADAPVGTFVGVGKGTGTGVGTGIAVGTTQGDFVTRGTIDTSGTRDTSGSGTNDVAVATGTATGALGGRTAEQIARVVKSRAGLAKACFEKELNRTPDLAGKVVIEFSIAADGTVTLAAIGSATTLDNDDVQSCIQRVVMRLKFPVADVASKVTFPFVFSKGR